MEKTHGSWCDQLRVRKVFQVYKFEAQFLPGTFVIKQSKPVLTFKNLNTELFFSY